MEQNDLLIQKVTPFMLNRPAQFFSRLHVAEFSFTMRQKIHKQNSKHSTYVFRAEFFFEVHFLGDVKYRHSMDCCFNSGLTYTTYVSPPVTIWFKIHQVPYCTAQGNLTDWLNFWFCATQTIFSVSSVNTTFDN